MKKILFGTTALVGALALTTAADEAKAQSINIGGALDLTISGSTDFGIEYADEDLEVEDPDGDGDRREFFFNQDHEIVFAGVGVGDTTGIEYGFNLQLERQDGDGAGFDEAYTFISGNFGEFRLGNEDAVTDQLLITASFVAAGTGGVDGNHRALGGHQIADSGEATKILYFTPQVAGFQGGISYAINSGDSGETAGLIAGTIDPVTGDVVGANTTNHVDVGANWQGEFGGVGLGVYGGATFFTVEQLAAVGDDEDVINYQFGGYADVMGIGLSGSLGFEDEDLPGARDFFYNIGVGGEFAGVGLSFNFQQDDFEDGTNQPENQEQYIFGASVPLLPGVALDADVAYVSDFQGDDDRDGLNALAELGVSF